jgi:hypothetical protein
MSTLTVQTSAHTALAIRAGAGVLIAIPAVVFYVILLSNAVDLPLRDDYGAILNFLNHMATLGGGRIAYLLAAQSTDYKLVFEHVIVWFQLALFNHIDFRVTCALGNGFVILLALVLWKMFLPGNLDLTNRMVLFTPVTWILFQLQYIGTLNWAMCALQHIPGLVFSLYAIYLLTQGTLRTFVGATLCLVAAIASSGNGFVLVPIGALILIPHLRRLALWLVVSGGCLAAYAYQYSPQGASNLHPDPLFILTFIGNAAEPPINGGFLAAGVILCPLLGLILCTFFVYAARTRYFDKNRAAAYSILFLLTTAIGVGCMHSDLGVRQSLSSRYGIYSTLLLIFAWFVIAEKFHHADCYSALKTSAFRVTLTLAVLFALFMDTAGYRYIVDRNKEVTDSMAAYRTSGGKIGPVLPLPNQPASFTQELNRFPAILEESVRLGIYHPPAY